MKQCGFVFGCVVSPSPDAWSRIPLWAWKEVACGIPMFSTATSMEKPAGVVPSVEASAAAARRPNSSIPGVEAPTGVRGSQVLRRGHACLNCAAWRHDVGRDVGWRDVGRGVGLGVLMLSATAPSGVIGRDDGFGAASKHWHTHMSTMASAQATKHWHTYMSTWLRLRRRSTG